MGPLNVMDNNNIFALDSLLYRISFEEHFPNVM